MAALTIQDGSKGVPPTFGAAAGGGDTVACGVRQGGWLLPVVLLVKNLDATTTDVTVGSLAAVTVPATSGVTAIPVHGSPYGTAVAVTYSKVTSLTVAAVRLTGPLE